MTNSHELRIVGKNGALDCNIQHGPECRERTRGRIVYKPIALRMSTKSVSISEGRIADARFFSLCEPDGTRKGGVTGVEIKNRGMNVDDGYLDKSLVVIDRP